MIVVRGLKESDIPALAELHVAAWQVAYRNILPDALLDHLSVDMAIERWTVLITEAGRTTLVAEQEGHPVGFVGFGASRDRDDNPEIVGEIYAIYVHPNRWERGAGRALMEQAVASLQQQGFTEVTVWTMRDNHPAKAFYEKVGFIFDGKEKESGRSGAKYQEVRYRQRI